MSSRIRIPSVKNFQIKQLPHGETEPSGEMVLEFGKACDKTFALDCRPPFSILQAFAVAIAIADSSLITTT